ncbi:hypothetical protein K438DRAFT_1775507 [Mycena galopus ATCC 62051]|nr:hypothetical protein K438DRAFT_1775507 [Mycena galopus ATCC 62051]
MASLAFPGTSRRTCIRTPIVSAGLPCGGSTRQMEIQIRFGSTFLHRSSDPGTENYGLANGHTLLRHLHDPSLEGTLQHRWMVKKRNVMPEIGWSQLRHRFTPGFEDILDVGVNKGWYNSDILLEALFRYVFIPWLQHELLHTVTESTIQQSVWTGTKFFLMEFRKISTNIRVTMIKVRPDAIDTVRNLYAPKDHEMCAEIGEPPVTRQSCWDIYLQLLNCFHTLDNLYNIPTDMDKKWGYALTLARNDYAKEIELLPNQRPLRNGDSVVGPGGFHYMGDVNNGNGLDSQQCACLDEMLNNDEPQVENGDDPQIFACFSDEEFPGPDEVEEW